LPANNGGKPMPAILLGQELGKKLKIKVGDRVRVISPKADLDISAWTQTGNAPSTAEFRLAGLFYTGFDEYDRRYAYVSLKDAQEDFETQHDTVTGVELKLDDSDHSEEAGQQLLVDLGDKAVPVIGWERWNHDTFAA